MALYEYKRVGAKYAVHWYGEPIGHVWMVAPGIWINDAYRGCRSLQPLDARLYYRTRELAAIALNRSQTCGMDSRKRCRACGSKLSAHNIKVARLRTLAKESP